MWEEPCISGENGSGAVFFSGCSLGCAYCQNHDISGGLNGKEITIKRLSEIFFELKEQGANNINLVTPDHFIPQIIEAIDMAKEQGFNLPFVYNCSGYEEIDALKLLHPYMPFITEEIFCTIQNEEESIMISKWPEYSEDRAFPAEEKAIETIKEAVRGIRNIRTEMNVAPSRKASVYVVSENDEIRRIFEEGKLFFASLAYANEIMIQADKTGIAEDAVSVVIPGATLYIPFAELVDIAQEIERLKKEQKRLEGELSRSRGMLSNERFLSKAPEAKIAEEKEKLAKYEQMMEQVTKRLEQLA